MKSFKKPDNIDKNKFLEELYETLRNNKFPNEKFFGKLISCIVNYNLINLDIPNVNVTIKRLGKISGISNDITIELNPKELKLKNLYFFMITICHECQHIKNSISRENTTRTYSFKEKEITFPLPDITVSLKDSFLKDLEFFDYNTNYLCCVEEKSARDYSIHEMKEIAKKLKELFIKDINANKKTEKLVSELLLLSEIGQEMETEDYSKNLTLLKTYEAKSKEEIIKNQQEFFDIYEKIAHYIFINDIKREDPNLSFKQKKAFKVLDQCAYNLIVTFYICNNQYVADRLFNIAKTINDKTTMLYIGMTPTIGLYENDINNLLKSSSTKTIQLVNEYLAVLSFMSDWDLQEITEKFFKLNNITTQNNFKYFQKVFYYYIEKSDIVEDFTSKTKKLIADGLIEKSFNNVQQQFKDIPKIAYNQSKEEKKDYNA